MKSKLELNLFKLFIKRVRKKLSRKKIKASYWYQECKENLKYSSSSFISEIQININTLNYIKLFMRMSYRKIRVKF